jgi:23S rRNA G2445 N2-methylase RlmL
MKGRLVLLFIALIRANLGLAFQLTVPTITHALHPRKVELYLPHTALDSTPNSLDSKTFSKKLFFATTIAGLESVLEKEIEELSDVSSIVRGKCNVAFCGSVKSGVEALLWLRTPLKIMELVADSVGIESKEAVYNWISSIHWNEMITANQTIKCDTVIGQGVTQELSHSHFTSLTIKNAIVDQFRARTREGLRPSVSLRDPDLPLLLYLHRGTARLYRVWSGESSLHKRGYRPDVTHKAALRETSAAGL